MTTARDMIKAGLRNIAVLGAGASLSDEEAQDAFDMLNGILASWSAEGSLIFQKTSETFSLTSAQSYTIGSGGDFDTERPNEITYMTVNYGSIDEPLYPMSQEQWASIGLKTTGAKPDSYYYDGNFPLGTIYFYPKPTGSETVAPQYEREASPTVKKMAKRFKDIVATQNNKTVKNLSTIDVPSRSGNDGNIYQGYE